MSTIDARILVVDIDQRGAALISGAPRSGGLQNDCKFDIFGHRPQLGGSVVSLRGRAGRPTLVCQLQLS